MDELKKNLVPQFVTSKSSKSPNSFAWHKTLGPGVCLDYFQSPPTVLAPLSFPTTVSATSLGHCPVEYSCKCFFSCLEVLVLHA